MTTVTIDDSLAARLRALRDKGDDFSQVVAEALDETAQRWEREAAGRAEMQAMLDGPRRPFDPAATYQKYREKFGWTEDLSGLSDEELTANYEAGIAVLPPEKKAEADRLGWL